MKPLQFVRITAVSLLLAVGLIACGDQKEYDGSSAPATVMAGSASRSLLPTVSGGRDYLKDAPGWPVASELDPDNPGIFIFTWDQGRIDVGNGNSDAPWVHDDVRATAVALERDAERLVLVTSNT